MALLPRFLSGQTASDGAGLSEEEQRRLRARVQQNAMAPRYLSDTDTVTDTPKPVTAVKPDAPVYTPDGPVLNESALTKRPTQPYPASVNPVTGTMSEADRLAITRPRSTMQLATATTTPTESEPMVVYGDKGQPRGVEGGGSEFEQQQSYLRALQSYKPTDNNGRLKSALLGFVRGLQGEKGHSLLGGAVDPASDERYANEREVARVGRGVAAEMGTRKAQSDLQNEQVERGYKQAQAHRVMNPVYAPEVVKGQDGYSTIDRSTNMAKPVYNPDGKRLQPSVTEKNAPHRTIDGVDYTQQDDGSWLETKGLPKAARVDIPGYGPMTPAQARQADALEGQRSRQDKRENMRDQRHTVERGEDKTQQGQERLAVRKEKAGKLTGDLDGARERWIKADEKVQLLSQQLKAETDADKKEQVSDLISRWEYDRSIAQRDAAAAASELHNSFGDIFEAGPGEGGLAYYKRKPFNVKTWRTKYPKATREQEAAAIQNATDMQMEIVR